jgi:hypothetical protein
MALAGASGTAVAGPLDGQWALERQDCTVSPGTSDRVSLAITDTRMEFYESACEMTAIEPIGSQGSAWRVTRTCRGEGETWTVSSIFALAPQPAASPRQLIEIELENGYVTIRHQCD